MCVRLRVLICGSRTWEDEEPIRCLLSSLSSGYTTVIHGGANGVDTIAGRLAKRMGMEVQVFYAEWTRYGKAAGPIRNRQMLVEGTPDIVHAFSVDLSVSKGTADMVQQARKSGVPVVIHQPDFVIE